jgi:hypothetical protein
MGKRGLSSLALRMAFGPIQDIIWKLGLVSQPVRVWSAL